jgi:hypothetical protein
MGEHEERSGKDVEGPEPGTPAHEEIVREAEDKAEKNAPDQAEEEENREKGRGDRKL